MTFTIGDDPQVYTLTRNVNVICDVEAETGLNLSIFAWSAGMTQSQMRAMLYAYLKPSHGVTLDEVGDLLSIAETESLLALGKAMGQKIEVKTEIPTE